jgi:hypothetical protein
MKNLGYITVASDVPLAEVDSALDTANQHLQDGAKEKRIMSNIKGHNDETGRRDPLVSGRIKRLASAALLAGSLLTGLAQASVPGSVLYRVAAVQNALGKKLADTNSAVDEKTAREKLAPAEFELAQWINWGNWGNWNNWHNWVNVNWGNF